MADFKSVFEKFIKVNFDGKINRASDGFDESKNYDTIRKFAAPKSDRFPTQERVEKWRALRPDLIGWDDLLESLRSPKTKRPFEEDRGVRHSATKQWKNLSEDGYVEADQQGQNSVLLRAAVSLLEAATQRIRAPKSPSGENDEQVLVEIVNESSSGLFNEIGRAQWRKALREFLTAGGQVNYWVRVDPSNTFQVQRLSKLALELSQFATSFRLYTFNSSNDAQSSRVINEMIFVDGVGALDAFVVEDQHVPEKVAYLFGPTDPRSVLVKRQIDSIKRFAETQTKDDKPVFELLPPYRNADKSDEHPELRFRKAVIDFEQASENFGGIIRRRNGLPHDTRNEAFLKNASWQLHITKYFQFKPDELDEYLDLQKRYRLVFEKLLKSGVTYTDLVPDWVFLALIGQPRHEARIAENYILTAPWHPDLNQQEIASTAILRVKRWKDLLEKYPAYRLVIVQSDVQIPDRWAFHTFGVTRNSGAGAGDTVLAEMYGWKGDGGIDDESFKRNLIFNDEAISKGLRKLAKDDENTLIRKEISSVSKNNSEAVSDPNQNAILWLERVLEAMEFLCAGKTIPDQIRRAYESFK